ncbi:hypothetical protein AMAG_04348 [Allomyces macrogynus ATCC 38327]|uniref:PH domain-containing protein n=1 Tax=Allomyces macrogynus (strain ATCC 38327) TaxID=578462 RepID=A0A0L0S8S0_ALLM3|nr:hypothetical protein AMAG_04348 [Allomyces macrogynus ATCC 38327]|eukprot:KNE58799.1 hypothetical protein AMAG_04348 [Allomyces macrogynus ATCC 38327]
MISPRKEYASSTLSSSTSTAATAVPPHLKTSPLKAAAGAAVGPGAPLSTYSAYHQHQHHLYATASHKSVRKGSMTSFASALRPSGSSASLKSLIEDPDVCRPNLPTRNVDSLRMPTHLNPQGLCPHLMQWARSPTLAGLQSSARLIKGYASERGGAELVHDEGDRALARRGDETFVFLQLTQLQNKSVPPMCEVFYTIHFNDSDQPSYVSKPWKISDVTSASANEAFLIPFERTIRVVLHVRFPILPKKKTSLMGSLKKKSSMEQLQGADIKLGETTITLAPIDFGKESIDLPLRIPDKLTAMLPWEITAPPSITLRLGVWTGAHVRALGEQSAAYAGNLTVQVQARRDTPRLWRRYWAELDPANAQVVLWDFEYKTARPAKHRVPLAHIVRVVNADPEQFPMPNVFQVAGANATLDGLVRYCSEDGMRDSAETVVPVENLDMFTFRADTPASAREWVQAFQATAALVRKNGGVGKKIVK